MMFQNYNRFTKIIDEDQQNLLSHYERIYPVVSCVVYAGRQTARLLEHAGNIPELNQL